MPSWGASSIDLILQRLENVQRVGVNEMSLHVSHMWEPGSARGSAWGLGGRVGHDSNLARTVTLLVAVSSAA